MSAKPSGSQRLATTVSELLYGIAGWMLVGVGVLGIVVQAGYVMDGLADPVLTPAVVIISMVLILFGVFVNPRFRRRLDRRHSLTQSGRIQSVDERVLHAAEGRTARCVACGSRLNRGLVRRYREEICLAGVPVFTSSQKYNHYCIECATVEFGTADGSEASSIGPEGEPKREIQHTTERR